ncbi:9425_t:CDS:2, partial [Cetraspora pellucida]
MTKITTKKYQPRISFSYLRPTTKDQHNYEYKQFGFKICLQQENKNSGLIIFKDFDNNNIIVPNRIKLVDLQDNSSIKDVTYNGISCFQIFWTDNNDGLGNNYQTISFKEIRKRSKFIRKRKPTNKKSLKCQKCEENYESIKNVSEKLENIEKKIDEYKIDKIPRYKFPD